MMQVEKDCFDNIMDQTKENGFSELSFTAAWDDKSESVFICCKSTVVGFTGKPAHHSVFSFI